MSEMRELLDSVNRVHRAGWARTKEELKGMGAPGKLSLRLLGQGSRMQSGKPDRREPAWARAHGLGPAEMWFLPERWFYGDVLKRLRPDDVVYDACAGNLALSVAMAAKVERVYAVEVNPTVLGAGVSLIGYGMPRGLVATCGNVLDVEVPSDVTVIVQLAMHFSGHPIAHWKNHRVIRVMNQQVVEQYPYPDGPTSQVAGGPLDMGGS